MASNGRIPLSELRRLVYVTGGTHYLRTNAAKALDRLAVESKKRGMGTYVTDSYRPYSVQVALRASWCRRGACHYAAVPGTSNHGWGIAADCATSSSSGLGRFMHKYSTLAAANGWIWPSWARSRPYEPWHFEYSADRDRYRGTTALVVGTPGADMITPKSRKSHIRAWQRLINRSCKRFNISGNELALDGVAGRVTLARWHKVLAAAQIPQHNSCELGDVVMLGQKGVQIG